MTGSPSPGDSDHTVILQGAQGVQVGDGNIQYNLHGSYIDFAEELDLHERDCLAHCPRSADGTPLLDGRAPDRAQIADIAFNGRGFCWVQAPMSAGKTAVAAWFTLAPPPNAVALACFLGPTTGGDQFLDVLIRRLSALLHDNSLASVSLPEKPLALAKLLEKAGHQYGEAGQHVFIVVDGLDEDPLSSSVMPVARLLPRELPEYVHLVVFSRPNPGPLPHDHPLREAAACYALAPAEEAIVETERAQEELDQVVRQGPSLAASILTMLAVAGPLTKADLADLLTPPIAREVAVAFDGPLRRLTYAVGLGAGQSYSIGHIGLQQAWADGLGTPAIESAMRQVDDWVDRYIARQWPAATPQYCLDGYVDMLVRRGDPVRLTAIATDQFRRSRLLAATSSRVAEATVIAKAQRSVSEMAGPDIGLATSLAVESLIVRNSLEEAARPEMAGFDVRRGEVRKAIDTVKALSPQSDYWHSAYVELVATLYLTSRDDMAEELLRRARSEHPEERLAASVAKRVAAERPDLAIRLANDEPGALAAIAASLAAHDAFLDLAISTVRGQPESQLEVARVLAPGHPRAALQAIAGFHGYNEWSAGSKIWRGGSFATVEVARSMTSAQEALDTLAAERKRGDHKAALVATGMCLARQHDASELAGSLGDSTSPECLLARFALGEDPALLVDRAVTAGLEWQTTDLDLLQRFHPVSAGSPAGTRASYARLLRSVHASGIESPEQAALAVLTQLLVIDDLGDADAKLIAERLGAETIRVNEVHKAAARRIALAEPRRGAALALDSGPQSTWVLRDVLRDIATHDLGLAVELTDLVDPQLSGTRSVVLGAVGALVDPRNTKLIDEISRRVPPPENSATVAFVVADLALRIAAMLPEGDERARQLLERFSSGADPRRDQGARVEQAIGRAVAGDTDAAMRLMAGSDSAPSVDGKTKSGWSRLTGHLPEALASNVLQERVLPRAKGRERQWALCTLASLDPVAAIRALLDGPPAAPAFAAVLRRASETCANATARVRVALEVERLMATEPALKALLLRWSACRASLAVASGSLSRQPEHELLHALLAGDDARPIVAACDDASIEPALFLAAWAYDQPGRLAQAVTAIIERFRSEVVPYLPERVHVLVAAAAQADTVTANAVIDDIDWRLAPDLQAQRLREESYEALVRELVHHDREAAYQRASVITDALVAKRALAVMAAAVASAPDGEPGPSLADVLTTVHSRVRLRSEFASDMLAELTWSSRVGPHAMVTLLGETSAWPATDSTWLFGRLFSLLGHDGHAAAAADAIIGTVARDASPAS